MTANTEYIFNTNAIAHLKDGISAVATSAVLYPGEATAFLRGWESGKEFFCTIANAAGDVEVVKVTAITNDTLTIARNQDGGGASEFAAGCPITQRLEGLQLTRFIQREAFRTIAYNPNGVLSADYPGEKVYQTGLVDCQIRWWKHSTGVLWRLVASGALCDTDYYDGGYIYSVVLNIIIFGGVSGSLNSDTDAFDTTLQSWAALGDMIAPARYLNGGALVGDYVYSFAGTSAVDSYLQDNDEYGYDLWAAKTDLPSPARTESACCGYQTNENPTNPIYSGFAVGGLASPAGAVMADNDQYSQSGDSWSAKDDYLAPTRGGLAIAGDISVGMVIFGGSAGASWYQDTDYFQEGSWEGKSDMPVPARREVAAASIDDDAFIFGGRADAEDYMNDTDKFIEDSDSWTSKTDIPSPNRRNSGAATYGDYIYIMSGTATGGGTSYDNDKYDPTGDSFTADTDVPAPDRRFLSAVGYI